MHSYDNISRRLKSASTKFALDVNQLSNCFVSFVRILRLKEVARVTARIALEFAPEFVYVYRLDFVECYLILLVMYFSVSLLLTPLCYDDIHDVTPRVFALAGCDMKSVGYNLKNWSEKLDDALWAFRTAYKTPTGWTPFIFVYEKACHLPVEIEHKLRDEAYGNTRIYKERTKKCIESRLRGDKNFKEGDKELLLMTRTLEYQSTDNDASESSHHHGVKLFASCELVADFSPAPERSSPSPYERRVVVGVVILLPKFVAYLTVEDFSSYIKVTDLLR
ncbi:reverse transcriptase domain-containing protein [Tanacetum coccineum]|uniref:Reverse transcriptase domain-containing protein n=1 Tax=Tanacetum coccineum TaxID=301880 RepID=A0ABQ5IYB1_9ASTR